LSELCRIEFVAEGKTHSRTANQANAGLDLCKELLPNEKGFTKSYLELDVPVHHNEHRNSPSLRNMPQKIENV